MKYFTPELYARGQSQDDDVLDEVEQRWEEASERYVAYLRSVEGALPPGIRHIHDSYYLHDSVILSMGRQGDRFVMVLQLDVPPHDRLSDLLVFTYELAGEPVIDREALPPELRCPVQVEWMYDEVEMAPGGAAGWVQSILLSNGWEVRLPLRDVHVQQLRPLIPPPGDERRAGPGRN
jgi:hypothetical protein